MLHTSLLSGLLSCMLADMGPVELSSSKSLAISPCIVNVSCVSSKSKARRVSNTDPEIITYSNNLKECKWKSLEMSLFNYADTAITIEHFPFSVTSSYSVNIRVSFSKLKVMQA